MKGIWLAAAAATVLGGCSTASTLTGGATAIPESFAGLYDPGPFGSGLGGMMGPPVRFTSSNGVQCQGRPNSVQPNGGMTLAISCDDGRRGAVTFDGPAPAIGKGKIGNDDVLMMLDAS